MRYSKPLDMVIGARNLDSEVFPHSGCCHWEEKPSCAQQRHTKSPMEGRGARNKAGALALWLFVPLGPALLMVSYHCYVTIVTHNLGLLVRSSILSSNWQLFCKQSTHPASRESCDLSEIHKCCSETTCIKSQSFNPTVKNI